MASNKCSRRYVEAIIPFHPAWNESEGGGKVCQIGCRMLLLWCLQDPMHPYAKWKNSLCRRLKTQLGAGEKYFEYVFKETEYAQYSWHRHIEDLARKIYGFLVGVDLMKLPDTIQTRPAVREKNTKGKAIVRHDNIVLASRAAQLAPSIFHKIDPTIAAVAHFKKLFDSGALPQVYKVCGSGEALRLFSTLPLLSPSTLQNCNILIESCLWDQSCEPAGWHANRTSPRYFCGRQVCVRAPVNPVPAHPRYMHYTTNCADSEGGAHVRTTHLAWIMESLVDGPNECVVEIANDEGGRTKMQVGRSELLQLNHRQVLPSTRRKKQTELQLEDGIRVDYDSPITRAKMCEIALTLVPLVRKMDFDGELNTLEDVQRHCVVAIRGCLDLITFQRGENGVLKEGRTRDRQRYCGDNATQFALHGQGHCHTVSSVMGAFLYPWQDVLQIDLQFRGGWHFGEKLRNDAVQDSPEHHQWLEFSCRPTMGAFVCDIYKQDGQEGDGKNPKFINWPRNEAYRDDLYCNGKLLVFSESPVSILPVNWDSEWGLSHVGK